jgi:polygalacturonase
MHLMDDTYTNFFVNDASRGKWWLKETRNYDISIRGVGHAVLDGGKPNDLIENEFTIYDENGNFAGRRTINGFTNCLINIGILMQNAERVEVSGIRFVRPRYWCMNFEYCAWGHIHDVVFDADGTNPNQDGLDIREGCHNFLVENLSGRTGDDMLALTNFGHPKKRTGEDTDMDTAIHDIVVRDLRATMSHRCDIIRLLCRGETEIYNVQISGVQDTTPPEIWRPLAAIRIGDVSDYPHRLNRLGEMRNVTVRDVCTRARFGCYIANTLCDSYFENIQMFGDGGTGIYFNGCELENVTVNGLCYGTLTSPDRSDLDYVSKFHRVTLDSISAVYFKDCISTKNLRFENLRTAKEMDYAFGGNSEISLIAENTVFQNESTKLSSMAKVTEK